MKLHMYFKQHNVYFTKEKTLLRAVLNHADKDMDRNTNFFCIYKVPSNSRTNFTFLGMWRRRGLVLLGT